MPASRPLSTLLASAALIGLTMSQVAHADIVDLGLVDSSPAVATFKHDAGLFADVVNFSVVQAGTFNVTVSDFDFAPTFANCSTPFFNTANLIGQLFKANAAPGSTPLTTLYTLDKTLSFVLPSAGDYQFRLSGQADGMVGGLYGVGVTVSAVPEPNMALLMLAGVGALGFNATRRRQMADNDRA